MIKKILIILTICFIFSCKTTSTQKLALPESDIVFISKNINRFCFSSENPQFLSEFLFLDKGSNFQLEGTWKNAYSILNLQVLGLLGETYLQLAVKKNEVKIISSKKETLQNEEIKNLMSFISSVGSSGLREIFCGSYAFNKKNILFKNDFYTVENELKIENRSIKVNSNLFLYDSPDNDNGYDLTIKSEFLYGFFNQNTNLQIHWNGYIDDMEVSPKNINVNYNKNKYELKILDYN